MTGRIKDAKLLNLYIAFLIDRNCAPETLATYRRHLLEYFSYAEKVGVAIKAINTDFVKRYVIYLKSLKLHNVTINNKLVSVRNFYDFLLRTQIVIHNAFRKVKKLRERKALPSCVSPSELGVAFEALGKNKLFELQDVAILDCFYGTGVTTSELCDLQLDDLLLEQGFLKVVSNKGGKERLIPLPQVTLVTLSKYLSFRKSRWPNSQYLFPNIHGNRFQRTNVYKIVKNFLDQTSAKKKGAHTLRHSYAIHMLSGGAGLRETQVLLGHVKPDTTVKYDNIAFVEVNDKAMNMD
ncbi:MAG: tyrosine-type recombinase/integrase [Bacteroidota bacterium]